MQWYRVSKFDPRFRVDGRYQRDEWTSYGDVGSIFSGRLLSVEEYLAVETRYILCVMELVSLCRVKALHISGLECYEDALPWVNEQVLSGAEITQFLRDGLREKCWARLCAESFVLDFGYEYYLHILSDLSLDTMIETAAKYQLFVEVWEPLR